MTDKRAYWIWLQSGLGYGAKTDEITAVFPSPDKMYEYGANEWRLSGCVSAAQIKRLNAYSPEQAQVIVDQCDRNGWKIINPDSPDYPPLLRSIRNFPLVLYCRGDLSCIKNKLTVSVVGSRSASLYSIGIAEQLCISLAKAGAIVVSGCALGVDSAAHEGALYGGGKTIAVLGCGINVPYLMKNDALRHNIAKNGAVISEYPPEMPAAKSSFPLRNRIISGLSRGTVIIEAGLKSGSLITANYAAEQGRDIFAIPGTLNSNDFTGVNKLIRDGAKPVFSVEDVLSEYAELYPETGIDLSPLSAEIVKDVEIASKSKPKQASAAKRKSTKPKHTEETTEIPTAADSPAQKRELPEYIRESTAKVYAFLGNEPMSVDDVVRVSGVGTDSAVSALAELEIYGFVKLLQGKQYIII